MQTSKKASYNLANSLKYTDTVTCFLIETVDSPVLKPKQSLLSDPYIPSARVGLLSTHALHHFLLLWLQQRNAFNTHAELITYTVFTRILRDLGFSITRRTSHFIPSISPATFRAHPLLSVFSTNNPMNGLSFRPFVYPDWNSLPPAIAMEFQQLQHLIDLERGRLSRVTFVPPPGAFPLSQPSYSPSNDGAFISPDSVPFGTEDTSYAEDSSVESEPLPPSEDAPILAPDPTDAPELEDLPPDAASELEDRI